MPILFASLIILAPLYVWRFVVPIGAIGGLPTNFLMLANFAVIGVAVIAVLRRRNWSKIKLNIFSLGRTLGSPLLISIGLFGFASLISLFAFGISGEKLAQWVVLYAQPLAIFFLIRYFFTETQHETENGKRGVMAVREKWIETFRVAVYVVVGAAGTLALIQYLTLFTLPPAWWGNANESKRAIAFFAHANAFGLFVTPLLAWLMPDAVEKLQKFYIKKSQLLLLALPFMCAIGALGMFLSLSRGAWLGLLVAVAVYALVLANKKVIICLFIAGVLLAGVVSVVPNLRYRVLLPFHGEKSTVARFSLWHTGTAMIKDNPILGKGIDGFSGNWNKYNTDPGLDHYNFPHNIFLNFWIDLGLLGLVSMVLILLLSAARGIAKWRSPKSGQDYGHNYKSEKAAALGLLLFIIALVVHGLIDIPYFKNDLALVFWIILALGL